MFFWTDSASCFLILPRWIFPMMSPLGVEVRGVLPEGIICLKPKIVRGMSNLHILPCI